MDPRQFQLGGTATGIGRSPFIQLIAEFPRKKVFWLESEYKTRVFTKPVAENRIHTDHLAIF